MIGLPEKGMEGFTGRFIRTDGEPVANSWGDLADGELAAMINLDETKSPVEDSVWTGTAVNGSEAQSHCSDWVFLQGAGTIGVTSDSNGLWTYKSNDTSCVNSAHLYCFQVSLF
jgi:hypothetical protein